MAITSLTAGESHGPAMTAILQGLPAGLPVSVDRINQDLARRQKSLGAGGRMRIEQDQVQILAGVMAGKTTGGPISLLVENRDHQRWQGKDIPAYTSPRPGHADLNGLVKYGFEDIRPVLERASARETVMRVATGAICRQFLDAFGIRVGGYVLSIGEVKADLKTISLEERIARAKDDPVSCPERSAAAKIEAEIAAVMQQKDTLGGVIEVVALGLPPGLGSYIQAEKRLDARIASAVMSVPAIKGMEIGDAFENAHIRGTQAHDPIRMENGQLIRPSNRCGGLEGGITTGEPLLVRVAMKPIATTLTPQHTVDLVKGEETLTTYERSDFCPVPRAVVILEAVLAQLLADALIEKLGGDSMEEMQPRFKPLRRATLQDVHLTGKAVQWW